MKFPSFPLLVCLIAVGFLGPAARAASEIPDVELRDQNGHTVHFYSDLVKGRVVAVNFIFTRCSTICPQLGAASAALVKKLGETADAANDRVISISIDPETDTPERLRAWSENFGAPPAWTLLTGDRREIDTLLKALQAYTPDKDLHSSTFLLGNDATGEWKRINGSVSPATLVETMRLLGAGAAGAAPPPSVAVSPPPAQDDVPAAAPVAEDTAAQRYFPDVTLLNQNGKALRFYSDLLKGKVVVIDTIFADCGGACPLMTERMAKVQTLLGDRVGRDVTLISITVDPANDTPERLLGYARHAGAKEGWQFLTGDKASLDLVLKKLGQYVDSREAHSNLFIIGNEPTGLWKKAFGLAAPEDIIDIVKSVANDHL